MEKKEIIPVLRSSIGISNNNNILLPDELWLLIFRYLNSYELLRATLVCKEWQRITYDDDLWRRLSDKVFTTQIEQSKNQINNWKEFYKVQYASLYLEPDKAQELRQSAQASKLDKLLNFTQTPIGTFLTISVLFIALIIMSSYMSRFNTEEKPKGNLRSYLTYFNLIIASIISLIVGPVIKKRFVIKRTTIKTFELIWNIYILYRLVVILFSYVNELTFTNLICMDKPYLQDWVDQAFIGSSMTVLLIPLYAQLVYNKFAILFIFINFICLDMPYKWIQYTIENICSIFVILMSSSNYRKYQLIFINIRSTGNIVFIISWAILRYFYSCSGYWWLFAIDLYFPIFIRVVTMHHLKRKASRANRL